MEVSEVLDFLRNLWNNFSISDNFSFFFPAPDRNFLYHLLHMSWSILETVEGKMSMSYSLILIYLTGNIEIYKFSWKNGNKTFEGDFDLNVIFKDGNLSVVKN